MRSWVSFGLLAALAVCGCKGNSTTRGDAGRGGRAVGHVADRHRGGSPADWNFGTGAPGSAPRQMPSPRVNPKIRIASRDQPS
jgi:hypothetical protein